MLSNSIIDILKNGINLRLESIEEEEHYIIKMQEYFETETEIGTYLRKDNVLEIENSNHDVEIEVYILNSTLFMVPYVQNIFESFSEVLRFISRCHEGIIRDFRGLEEFKIQSIEDVNRVENEKQKEIEQEDEDPSSDDDYEWI